MTDYQKLSKRCEWEEIVLREFLKAEQQNLGLTISATEMGAQPVQKQADLFYMWRLFLFWILYLDPKKSNLFMFETCTQAPRLEVPSVNSFK